MGPELLAPHGVAELRAGLAHRERVVYASNGNRATSGRALLRRLEALAPAIGVTRVADISRLVPNRFPVYQATRPGLFLHHSIGQNSGAQGKGATALQAKLSCLVESVESFCAEPRAVHLMRGSYAELRHHHALVPPGAPADEPFMWTEAYHLGARAPVWVPAEAVYFPFLAAAYGTRSAFPCSTSGLAGGATYLEAAVHGLYEVIEHMYIGHAERGELRVEALFEDEYTGFDLAAFRRAEPDIELQLYALELAGVRNLPMIACVLVGDDRVSYGWGCCSSVDMAMSRAVSEALQSYTIGVAGSREDLDDDGPTSRRHVAAFAQPERRTLHLAAYRRRTHDRRFGSLGGELRAVLRWLAALDYRDVCIANLTRRMIDIPIVRVVVCGLPTKAAIAGAYGGSLNFEGVAARAYGTTA